VQHVLRAEATCARRDASTQRLLTVLGSLSLDLLAASAHERPCDALAHLHLDVGWIYDRVGAVLRDVALVECEHHVAELVRGGARPHAADGGA
jgi:hypothetical protein